LNQYFVPVTVANEVTGEKGSAAPAEKKEHRRIYLDFYQKNLGVGNVHVYVLGPDASAIGGLDINSAIDSAKMIALLEQVAGKLGTKAGAPVVRPHATSRPPAFAPDALVVHLVSRALADGSWHQYPSENWIVLSRAEWTQLLPEKATPNAAWEIPHAVAVKLAEWVYPQNEDASRANRSRVDVADFRMQVVTVRGDMARARIQGKVRLMHTFYPGGKSEDFADSELTGYLDFNTAERSIQRLRIVTTKGDYANKWPFLTSLVSMSRETLEAVGQ
jgi:hypothetical protein